MSKTAMMQFLAQCEAWKYDFEKIHIDNIIEAAQALLPTEKQQIQQAYYTGSGHTWQSSDQYYLTTYNSEQ